MSHLTAPAQKVADILTAGGVPATLDPRNVNPPSALVGPSRTTRRTVSRVAVELEARFYAPGPANSDALDALDRMADLATVALDDAGLTWTEGVIGTANSPQTGENLLCYSLTIPLLTQEL
jgi:hypothetical protein